MAFRYSPKIVTDGLVLCLDAANPRSFVSGSTTWNDLTPNLYNGTLTNGPTYNTSNGGSFVFDGVDDFVNIPLKTLSGDPNFTIFGFFKLNNSFAGGSTWGIGGGSSQTGINTYNLVTNEISIDFWGTATFGTNMFYGDTWKFICWSKSSGVFSRDNIKIFINDTKYTQNDLIVRRGNETTLPNLNSNGFVIGRADISGGYYGSVYNANLYVYNKVLSDFEILQNYNATKSRFGL